MVACALFKVVEIPELEKGVDLREESNASTTPLPIHREQERITIIKRGELKGAK